MDEIYEWLNPRIPVEYVLISFLVLSVAIVIGMLVMKGHRVKRFVLESLPADCHIADSTAAADLQADRTADYNFGCTVCRRCFDNIRFAAAV